eukprot:14079899-Alexandrium_andersonii.AAC.1
MLLTDHELTNRLVARSRCIVQVRAGEGDAMLRQPIQAGAQPTAELGDRLVVGRAGSSPLGARRE